jgi:hypothetical protein
MNKCLECGKDVTQTVGKRKKEYCGNTCRVKFYLKKKNEGKPKVKRGRPVKKEKPTTTVGVIKQIAENMGTEAVAINSGFSIDFGDDWILDVEKYTLFPKKERPIEKWEAVEWDKIKLYHDKKIREAWAIHKSKNQ